ncbi:hypothetical protein D9757_004681 [Collybiopsis confluens]|uniref:Rab-GAP TBC domain-containing protein n=1 Tax=Collybiopsis confluens TaxID=2823264 RepID=A0A8H5HS48_9AGAR|nr:hypothetical protein D9757_004681 [Collybiopsis confluens]
MDDDDPFNIKLEPSLDIGDAFSDADDLTSALHFSADAIRNDLTGNGDSWKVVHEPHDESDSDTQADEIPAATEGASQSQFFSIPLSGSEDGLELDMSRNEDHHLDTTEDQEDQEAEQPYPAVVIDVSSHKIALSAVLSSSPKDSSHSRTSSVAGSEVSSRSIQSLPTPEPTSTTPTHSIFVASSSTSVLPSSSAAGAVAATSSTDTQRSSLKPLVPTHRPTRSTGPSALEKVRSKTRPSFLPPKSRQEDDKHMADWEVMMKHSRAAAEKRRKALQERRLAREKKIEDSLQLWEREIVPDWRVVHKNPQLRKLWWKGIPTKLRATMWERAVGNPLALSKDNFRSCSSRAKRALSNGAFSDATLLKIEADIASTLPGLHIFHHETGPLYLDLKELLTAWVVARADEGLGYVAGVAKIAAMFLINMPIQQAFVVMRNLLERHVLRSFFGGSGSKEDVEAYYRIFDTLLADGMPKIYFNFKQHQISPASYLPDWIIPLFLNHLPFEACARIWDVLLLEGDSFLYRAALGILAVLEPRLFFPDRKELSELLQGENRAAIEVAKREGWTLDGGKYEIYGVDEETLWERIDSMDEWWKQSTWNRLIRRELPDL